MPNRSYFCPDSFIPDANLTDWAKKTFRVTEKEILRQLELMKDHEFRRPYSCWKRVFRNWLRKADQIGTFKRERQYKQPERLSSEERRQDQQRFEEQMRKFGVKV
jgi:hypothetical protein